MAVKLNIGVIGGHLATKKQTLLAEKTGALIAKKGAVLITGGLDGIMEAASRGAKKEGGVVVAILPSLDKSQANEFVDIALPTSMGFGRNILIASACDALIAIGGSYGTLSECAFALNYQKKLIVLDGSGGTADAMKKLPFEFFVAKTPEEALAFATEDSK